MSEAEGDEMAGCFVVHEKSSKEKTETKEKQHEESTKEMKRTAKSKKQKIQLIGNCTQTKNQQNTLQTYYKHHQAKNRLNQGKEIDKRTPEKHLGLTRWWGYRLHTGGTDD